MKEHALKRNILVLLCVLLLPAVCDRKSSIPVPDAPTMFLCFTVYFKEDEEKISFAA